MIAFDERETLAVTSPDEVERDLARLAIQHPEHADLLNYAGRLLVRQAATLALVKGAVKKV